MMTNAVVAAAVVGIDGDDVIAWVAMEHSMPESFSSKMRLH